jgi:hypothetical protein
MMWWWIVLIVLVLGMLFAMWVILRTFKMFLRGAIVAVIFVVIIFGYMNLVNRTPAAPLDEVKECHLDLCDCKCYMEGWNSKGKIDENSAPLLCGINCLGEFNVSGCEYKEGRGCVELGE